MFDTPACTGYIRTMATFNLTEYTGDVARVTLVTIGTASTRGFDDANTSATPDRVYAASIGHTLACYYFRAFADQRVNVEFSQRRMDSTL